MPITHIHSYLVHPAKSIDPQPAISGTSVPMTGALYSMLAKILRRSPEECDIQIVFSPDTDGRQNNACREALEAYARAPGLGSGRFVAERLQSVTTNRSGLGLLFLVTSADDQGRHQLMISRFPADQGVVAEEKANKLTVEFIERVFMKNAKAYKSALYVSDSLDAGFAEGRAVDRQLSGPRELSDYWIREFLESELRTTGPAGSRRLAEALRSAVQSAGDPSLKQELVAAAQLMNGQDGATRSARSIIQRLGLSDNAAAAINHAFPRPELLNDAFRFDAAEFNRHARYRAVELDNGAMLMAEDSRFSEVFQSQHLEGERRVRYTTEGSVIDQKLRKTR